MNVIDKLHCLNVLDSDILIWLCVLCISLRPQAHYHLQVLIFYPPKEPLDGPQVLRGQRSNWSAEAYKQVGSPNNHLFHKV